MSKITSEILQKIAPSTPKSLRDRFLPFMNEAMPRYGIDTKDRVSGFLCTTCFESQYFQKTKEGKARANTVAGRAQSHYWATGFMGRGLIQTTHEENYQLVGEYLHNKGVIDDPDLFVNNPELLEEPKWAVESACVFWVTNNLNKFADKKNIFAIEGIVNRGNPAKQAWGEADREKLWKTLERVLPDDFHLDSTDSSSTQTNGSKGQEMPNTEVSGQPAEPAPLASEPPPSLVPVTTPVVEVEQISAQPSDSKEPPKEDFVTRLTGRVVALPAAILSALAGLWTWLTSSPANVTIAFLVIASIILIIYLIINAIRNSGKEKRQHSTELAEIELKKQREEQAFELQKITMQSAMHDNLNTIRIVPPPTTMPNSDVPKEG